MIYAVGDIHGQITMLRRLMDQIRMHFNPSQDTLLFLGDYIDRGEDSKAVIDTVIEAGEEYPGTIYLRGNHEQLMMDARNGPPPEPSEQPGYVMYSDIMINWMENGGSNTLLSYGVEDWLRWWEAIPDSHWEFVRNTQIEYVTETYHFVHAGLLREGEHWEGDDWNLDPRLWIREPFLSSKDLYDGRVVVFGHTPQTSGRPRVEYNKIGLDTAAVFGEKLTCGIFNPSAIPMYRLDFEVLVAPYNR